MARTALRLNVVLLVSYVGVACSSFSESDSPVDVGPSDDAGGEADVTVRSDATVGSDARDADGSDFLVLANSYTNLRDVVADESWAYVAEQSPGGIHLIPLPDNPALSPAPHLASAPTALAASSGNLFWFDNKDASLHSWNPTLGQSNTNPESQPIAALALGGLYVASLVKHDAGVAGSIELRAQAALGTTLGMVETPNPFDIVIHGTDVFWTDVDIHHFVIKSSTNTSPDTFAPCPSSDCEYITANDAGVYWTQSSSVAGRTMSGGTMLSLGANEPGPSAIASDESGVYWIVNDGRVRRWTSDGKTTTVSSGFPVLQDMNARPLALTSRYVIWLSGDGRVLAHSK